MGYLTQLVNDQQSWIGGTLREKHDEIDRAICGVPEFSETKITRFELEKGFFWIRGVEFDCGFALNFAGVGKSPYEGFLWFAGPYTSCGIQKPPSKGGEQ